jgi:ferritin-like metal-binding protein YciE
MKQTPKGKTLPCYPGAGRGGRRSDGGFRRFSDADAGLLSGAQAVEHYEISRYSTLIAWAEQLGMKQAAQLLEQTLEEEKKTDAALNKLAEAAINRKAA